GVDDHKGARWSGEGLFPPTVHAKRRNEMRKIGLIAALALVGVPGAALAAQPQHPATPANSNASSHANATSTTGTSGQASANAQSVKVLFVLRGTLGAYAAANGATNGSIAITVKSSNHESTLLKNTTLT